LEGNYANHYTTDAHNKTQLSTALKFKY